MEYNETKRGLEKAAGIVGFITSLIWVGVLIYCLIGMSEQFEAYKKTSNDIQLIHTYYIVILILFFFDVINSLFLFIFSYCIIESPVKEDGTVVNTTKLRIAFLIFAILSFNIIAIGLIIPVLCLKDFKKTPQVQTSFNLQNNEAQQNLIDFKVAELKHLKEIGVIEDEVYNKAIDKIINEYKKELKK